MTELAASVRAVTGRLIDMLDARLAGRLEALYLVGSVAQGDYREGRSDIDFVAVLGEPHDVAVLSTIHAELAWRYRGVHCDGIYLRPGELSASPCGTGISAREGRVHAASGDERHPVTWLLLADTGIALRGRGPDASWIAADRDAAIRHSRANLDLYWRNWIDSRRRLLSPAGLSLLTDTAVTWGCLGIARLRATIAQGRVPSKTGAGEYALDAFPGHTRIVTEALRLRTDPAAPALYRSPLARRRDAIAFIDAALAETG